MTEFENFPHPVVNMKGERVSPDERLIALFKEIAEPLKGKFAHEINDYQLTPEQRKRIANTSTGYDIRSQVGTLGARWLPTAEAILRLRQVQPDLDSQAVSFDLMTEVSEMVEGYYSRHKFVRVIEFVSALEAFEKLGILKRGLLVAEFSSFEDLSKI